MDMEIVFPGGKKVHALYKGFTIQTDQPPHAGGDGSAPAPFDLFLASIGTCAGVYVLSFCQERNIPPQGIKLTLETERDPEKKRISRIDIHIHLPEEFPQKYREAVVRSAELCAVARLIYDPPKIDVHATIATAANGGGSGRGAPA